MSDLRASDVLGGTSIGIRYAEVLLSIFLRSVEFLGEKNILLFLLKDKANKANKVFLLAFYCNFALIDINIGPNE